jgi:lipoprotein-anchoring transpeptidase ErfK/SrfK
MRHSFHLRAVVLTASLVLPSLAWAQAPQSNLGGGLIEFLVTGGRNPAYAPPPEYAPPPVYAPQPDYAPAPRTVRRARRPAGVIYGEPIEEDPFAAGAHVPPRGVYGYDELMDDPLETRPPPRRARPRVARVPDPSRSPREDWVPQAALPAQLQRQEVAYDGGEKPGTIIVDTRARFLYLVQPGGTAIRYGIGVGREGFTWKGRQVISTKREWPSWRPPAEMRKRQPELPRFMAGGPKNPLGARALYLGNTLFRIHGTNQPSTIGRAVSSGCIRMMNNDVIDLYNRVPIGAPVIVS